nr:retrotransposon-derived protein PEG10 [Misgurnus anguillicaudatus]
MCTGKCAKCTGDLLFPLGLLSIVANILLFFPNGEVWRTEEITEKIWFFPGVIGSGLLVFLPASVMRAAGVDGNCCANRCGMMVSMLMSALGGAGAVYCMIVSAIGLQDGPLCDTGDGIFIYPFINRTTESSFHVAAYHLDYRLSSSCWDPCSCCRLRKDLTIMEAAGDRSPSHLEEFLQRTVGRMDRQEKAIDEMGRAFQAMVTKVSELALQAQQHHPPPPTAPPTPPTPPITTGGSPQSEPRLPIPEKYAGEPKFCRSFLSHCSLHFALQPRTFTTEEMKVAFVLSLLTGKAALWGTAVWENQDRCCASFHALSEEMRRVFDRSVAGREAARLLADLRQEDRSVSDYSIEFRTLAAECKWNEEAQWDHFLHGLADRIQQEIRAVELPSSLNGLIDLTIRIDNRLDQAARRRGRTTRTTSPEVQHRRPEVAVSPPGDLEPMQAEIPWTVFILWQPRTSHPALPSKRSSPIVNLRLLSGGISARKTSSTSTLLPVRLRWSTHTLDQHALVDSGAEGSFMDFNFARKIKIPLTSLKHPIAPFALDGHKLPVITQTTIPVSLITSGNHTEKISFLITDSPQTPIVLGHTWLHKHNPRIDWRLGSVVSWSEECHLSCLLSAGVNVSESVFQGEAVDLTNVPAEYHDLKEVFNPHFMLLHTTWIIVSRRRVGIRVRVVVSV